MTPRKLTGFAKKVAFIAQRRKPRLAAKLAKISLEVMLHKRVPPFRQVEIQTTFACNLGCVHCSAASFHSDDTPLELPDYAEIARQCRQHDVPMVSFTGGEPLFDPRIEEIIQRFDTASTLISVTTNGTLLTPERARRLRTIGVDCLVISLDGPDAQSNDPIRGTGTFDQILEAIQLGRSLGFFVMIIHTLSHQSMRSGNFKRLIDLADSLGVPLHVSLAAPAGNWASDKAMRDFVLTADDIDRLWQLQARHAHLRRDLEGNYVGLGCPAGTERFVISPSGDVLPCTKIQATFGNVRNESMLAIRQRIAERELFRSSPAVCLVAEDRDFLDSYLPGIFGRRDLPIPHEEYFGEPLAGLACPACGASEFHLRYEALEDYEYRIPISPALLQCGRCGLISQERIPGYDELGALYPDDYLVYNQSFTSGSSALFAQLKRMLYESRARRVAAHIGRKGRILDVGCANGAFLTSMQGHGEYELHGLDIKNTGVDFESLGIQFREGALEQLDYPEGFFDAVILDNLIEHVPDPQAFMHKVHALLAPGGYVFGTTPNFDSVDRYMFGRYWGGFHMPRHLFLFNAQNLRTFLERTGFTDIRLPPTANAGDWAVSVQNLLRRNQPKRGRYRRGGYFPLVGLALAPVALLTSTLARNGVMDFICRKKD